MKARRKLVLHRREDLEPEDRTDEQLTELARAWLAAGRQDRQTVAAVIVAMWQAMGGRP